MKHKHSGDWRPGPETPRAYSFDAAFCDDPECGLHIVAQYQSGKPICEIVMSADQTRALIEICQDYLYDKAVRRTP
ncbi:hypothetical protein [Bradyrhizobium elkanii]|uniref:hypothetical protein n=1 Tax=Bradyrhizobium elkanii TaxID=29448 RepID=UPI0004B833ED|nr:hypothetical protein [Bradyrhizobium elkanii]WLA79602.1 hypothetical protein QNJ99_29925 [Bradyrhizobium elkanii]